MDLRACDAGAAFNPFTSLIQFEGGGLERLIYGLPFISDPPRLPRDAPGRWITSALHHELTHLASIRATRLGWALGSEAARLLKAFRGHPPGSGAVSLDVSSACARLLGVYQPILEGLALYAELDADERPGERVLPNPVPLHAQMVVTGHIRREDRVFLVAKHEACLDSGRVGPGLLRLLFADRKRPDLSYYLVGYLWVRAAAALIAHRCPRLGRPPVMLPLLIKLLCDHPVIDDAWSGQALEADIAGALRKTVSGTTAEALARVDAALDDAGLAALFEMWRLHDFLAAPGQAAPDVTPLRSNAFFSEHPRKDDLTVRGATSVWLSGRTTGRLSGLTADGAGGIELALTGVPGGDTATVHLVETNILWNALLNGGLNGPPRDAMLRNRARAARRWNRVLLKLDRLRGRQITLATYVTMSYPAAFGMLVWDESHGGMPPFQIPCSAEWYETGLIRDLTEAAQAFPPSERLAFAKAVTVPDTLADARHASVQELSADLVSDAALRDALIRWRLDGLLDASGKVQLEDWVAMPLGFGNAWNLAPEAAGQVDRAMDLPGFLADGAAVLRARDLLPIIPPLDMSGKGSNRAPRGAP